MTYSTIVKTKMLAVNTLDYLVSVEIKDDNGSYIDFSDRASIDSIASLRLSTDKKPNKLVSSISKVVLDNADNYFNAMDDPADADTVAEFGTLASDFSTGFRNRDVRLAIKIRLPDDTWETCHTGIYRIKNLFPSEINQTVSLKLAPDVDLLREIGTETISHGKSQHLNKPVSFLVPEILKKVYPEGIGSNFELPNRIYLETFDGEPVFSHYGKPPEYDGDTGRWRDDITKKPTAVYYDGADFYFGIENELWKFTPSTETYDYIGAFADSDTYARAIYPYEAGYLLVVGVKKSHTARNDLGRCGYITKATPSFTENSATYDLDLFTGDFVWRETAGISAVCVIGNISNISGVGDVIHGVNMPVPFPQCIYFGQDDTPYDKWIGFDDAGSLTGAVPSADCEEFTSAQYVYKTFLETGYLCFYVESPPTTPDPPGCQVYWGMKPNITAGDTVNWGYEVFVVQNDGVAAGKNNSGTAWLEWISDKAGFHSDINETDFSGADAHIYGLVFIATSTNDYLEWFTVDWGETYDSTAPLATSDPVFKIQQGRLTDSGGSPYLADANIFNLWTAGDDIFDADDSLYAPIQMYPVYDTALTVSSFNVIVMLDLDDIGGTCYKLYIITGWSGSKTVVAESYYGWSNFVYDADSEAVYFIERDTGRVCKFDVSGASLPTSYEVLGEGFEPVSQSLFEMPQTDGLIPETDGSKTYLYGVQYPGIPGYACEDDVWPAGKYFFWQYHKEVTDRVELFDMDRDNAFDALGLLAEAVDYMVGLDPNGTGFFRELPDSSTSEEFTIDLDSAVGRHFTLTKDAGLEDIVNRSVFIPYEATPGDPKATLDLVGFVDSGGDQEYFNGQTEVKSSTLIEKNIILHCIKAGSIDSAIFKYRVYEFQVQTALREDVSAGDLDLIRLDSNQDVAVNMLVQIADFEGAAPITAPLHVDTIEADGDIDLSENLDQAYKKGTAVIFTEATQGKWSTEYDTPATYTAESSWNEIGDTGIYLKFTEDDDAPKNFAVGDRITIHNPGLELAKSRTKKYQTEDKTSIDSYGLKERNFDNPYMSIGLGMERVDRLIDSEDDPKHSWVLSCPLFLQARPLKTIILKGRRALPTATDNEELVYIREASHDFKTGKSLLKLRAVSSY